MQPTISVGILSSEKIQFIFNDTFRLENQTFVGKHAASIHQGKILFNNEVYDEILFSPTTNSSSFDLLDVVIGIGFHWQRKEIQRFEGQLKIIVETDKLTAINSLPVEAYLLSVISSEMSATSSLELLKAHAVISRSWLLAQLSALNPPRADLRNPNNAKNSHLDNKEGLGEAIKWYDKDDHANFDVCADDHCQRYQGITKASTKAVKQAIELTFGQVLMYQNTICDARFSKCCGGITELFENCWQPEHHNYLLPVEDIPNGEVTVLKTEQAYEAFIRTSDAAHFCNTSDFKVLSQVLNSYDQETPDFYRWKVSYTQSELADLLRIRSGVDFGQILHLVPVERGVSGRLIKLKIVGSKQTLTVGKELEIRKWLSHSHLYSSAFVVEKGKLVHGVPENFTLVGAGWGHGVGLCQIGAAVMAEKGYLYKDILAHYFRNTAVERIY